MPDHRCGSRPSSLCALTGAAALVATGCHKSDKTNARPASGIAAETVSPTPPSPPSPPSPPAVPPMPMPPGYAGVLLAVPRTAASFTAGLAIFETPEGGKDSKVLLDAVKAANADAKVAILPDGWIATLSYADIVVRTVAGVTLQCSAADSDVPPHELTVATCRNWHVNGDNILVPVGVPRAGSEYKTEVGIGDDHVELVQLDARTKPATVDDEVAGAEGVKILKQETTPDGYAVAYQSTTPEGILSTAAVRMKVGGALVHCGIRSAGSADDALRALALCNALRAP